MAWRKVSKKDLINLMRRVAFVAGGLTEDKIMHSTSVADIALQIADAMIADGVDVDRQAVYAGALFHDVGLAKVGISEAVRASPEHCGWGGWLCRKWGFPEAVAQGPEGHECWTPELARKLDFPEPIQESYHPTTIEGKIAAYSDWSGPRLLNMDPWKDPETYYSCRDSWWTRERPYESQMIGANIGITKVMLEDRRERALKTQKEIRRLCFPYLKKEFFTKSIIERRGHEGWHIGPWFPLPKKARQPAELDLDKLGKVYVKGKWRKLSSFP